MLGWLLRLLGVGRPALARPSADPTNRSPGTPPRPVAAPAPDVQRERRRQIVAYVSRVRAPIRQAVAARQLWLADLGKVYESILTSPTGQILDRAGRVGADHEPAFRDSLFLAQSLEPPKDAEEVHAALVGWLTALHAACLALIDARQLKDRSMLGTFREQLGRARKHAAKLVAEREALFERHRLKVRPTIRSTPDRPKRDAGAAPLQPRRRREKGEQPAARPSRSAVAQSKKSTRRPATRAPRSDGKQARTRAADNGVATVALTDVVQI